MSSNSVPSQEKQYNDIMDLNLGLKQESLEVAKAYTMALIPRFKEMVKLCLQEQRLGRLTEEGLSSLV